MQATPRAADRGDLVLLVCITIGAADADVGLVDSCVFPPSLTDVADEGSQIDEQGDLHLADHDADGICDPEVLALHLTSDDAERRDASLRGLECETEGT